MKQLQPGRSALFLIEKQTSLIRGVFIPTTAAKKLINDKIWLRKDQCCYPSQIKFDLHSSYPALPKDSELSPPFLRRMKIKGKFLDKHRVKLLIDALELYQQQQQTFFPAYSPMPFQMPSQNPQQNQNNYLMSPVSSNPSLSPNGAPMAAPFDMFAPNMNSPGPMSMNSPFNEFFLQNFASLMQGDCYGSNMPPSEYNTVPFSPDGKPFMQAPQMSPMNSDTTYNYLGDNSK